MTTDPKAERVLALTLVASPAAYDYVGDLLDRRMFSDALAARIYDAVQVLLFSNRPVNAISVQAEMVEKAGGSVVPGWNKGATVSPQEALPLGQRIRECWARRELEALSARLGEVANAQGSQAALAQMAEAMSALSSQAENRARSMGELSLAYLEELKVQVEHPEKCTTIPTGYAAVDEHTGGFRVGELFVVAARPSQGKTSFISGMIANLARAGVPVGAFWLEDDWRDAVRRYHQARHYLTSEELRREPRVAYSRLTDVAARDMDEQARIFVDDTHGLTIDDIAARMRRMNREQGVRVFFADHLGEIGIDRDDRWGDRHDLALGKAARVYRDTAKSLGAVPVLCAQMNRGVERRSDHTPILSDLDGSGQVEQAARVLAFVNQPTDENGKPTGEFILHVRKNMAGPKGEIRLKWIPERMAVVNP